EWKNPAIPPALARRLGNPLRRGRIIYANCPYCGEAESKRIALDANDQVELEWTACGCDGRSADSILAAAGQEEAKRKDAVVLQEIDATDLASEAIQPLVCLPLLGQDGFVPRGYFTLLACLPKGGKTRLIAESLAAWLERGESVLY